MKDLPNAFWAFLFILLACIVAIVALVYPSTATVTMAVVTIASNIVSGSFGYISGHAAGAQTTTTATGQNATVNADPLASTK